MHAFRPLCLFLIGVLAGAGVGCEEERRVPYIVPELQNWPKRYEGIRGLELHVFSVGTLDVVEAAVLKGGSVTQRRKLPVFAYVLKHPRQGLVIINTGLGHRFSEADVELGGLLGMTLEARLEEGQDLPSQMKAAKLPPEKVRWVILSDLRFVNAGEVEAFDQARVVVTRNEHRAASRGGEEYARADFDDIENWKFVDLTEGKPIGTLPSAIDLFGDGSCLIVDAQGRTDGSVGILLRLRPKAVLLAGSLAPVPETVRYAARPASLADVDAWWDRIWRVKRFKDLESALVVVPAHSGDELSALDSKEVIIHAFDAPSGDA